MKRRAIAIVCAVLLASACGPSLSDAARVWCRDHQVRVFETGVRLGVFKVGAGDAFEMLSFSGVGRFDYLESTSEYVRACSAAYDLYS